MIRATIFVTALALLLLLVRLLVIRYIPAVEVNKLWIAFPTGLLLYLICSLSPVSGLGYFYELDFIFYKQHSFTPRFFYFCTSIAVLFLTKSVINSIRFERHLIRNRIYNRSYLVRFSALWPKSVRKEYRVYYTDGSVSACSSNKNIYISHDEESLSGELESLIAAHELMHCMQYDFFWNIVRTFIRSFFWFNPIILLACRQSEEDMEAACDEFALRDVSFDMKKKYAHKLVSLSQTPAPSYMPGISSNAKRVLESRIRRILYSGAKYKGNVLSIILILLVIATAFALTPNVTYSVTSTYIPFFWVSIS